MVEKGADVADLRSKSKLGLNAILSGEIDRKGYGSITPGPDDGSARSFFVDHYSIASDGLRLWLFQLRR